MHEPLITVADLRGGAPGVCPPTVQNFLNFMQFFRNFGKIIGRHPLPEGLAPPPTENPGSAPVLVSTYVVCERLSVKQVVEILVHKSQFTLNSGGFRGVLPACAPPTVQNFLNFM